MLKMYHKHAQEGSSPAYWEEAWGDGRFDEALRFCEVDPLRLVFERHVKPGQLMLEGGCGRGHYVAYHATRGVKVVGLDFARHTLGDLRRRDRNLILCAGDVANLPFRDKSFDVYYSGGVVEHFESGAQPSLQEAWRVLRPGATLLITVPYLSPLRRAVSLLRAEDRKWVSDPVIDKSAQRGEGRFFQYAYTTNEFIGMLAAAGFRVVSTRAYSIIWGLYELPWVARVMTRIEHRRKKAGAHMPSPAERVAPSNDGVPVVACGSVLKRLLVGEDESVPFAGLFIRSLRWACANMMMYVCFREEEGRLH